MNKIKLYIENNEVELQEEVQVAITRQFEEIYNPTIICNDYTKSVKIPMTDHNNQLFGNIYCPDMVTVYGSTDNAGIYFDPYKKLSFRLEWNGDLLMMGYAKMLSTKKEGNTGYYEVTLNGELGRIFQELKKITFDPTQSGDTDYYIDGSQYINEQITKELVYSGWTTPQVIMNIDDPNIKFTDIINFAPCNAFDENFDYKSFQFTENGVETGKEFINVLENTDFSGKTHIEPDIAIPDGLTPRGIGEYRSYLQQPFIYFNKLFQIFKKKAETLTGYSFNTSDAWFWNGNPHWSQLVFMLKKLDVNNGHTYNNDYNELRAHYYGQSYGQQLGTWVYEDYWADPLYRYIRPTAIINEDYPLLYNTSGATGQNYFNTIENFDYMLYFNLYTKLLTAAEGKRIKTDNGLKFTVSAIGSNGHTEKVKYLVVDEGYTGSTAGYTVIRTTTSSTETYQGYNYIDLFFADGFTITREKFGAYVYLESEAVWLKNEYPLTLGVSPFYLNMQDISQIGIRVRGEHSLRSGSYFTLNDLWNNEYNLFEQILNYCKMYRIFIIVDEYNKELKFISDFKYFENYTVEDWTDKVCTDKEFSVKPITWEHKYVLFNYEDNKTKIGEEYRTEYGFDYGEKQIVTDYNFNTDTDELFSGVSPSLVYTPNVLSWASLYENKKVVYTMPAEIYVHMADKDDQYVDQFGAFYIMRGMSYFDTSGDMRTVYISDDTPLQEYNNTYFYSQRGILINRYPYLDIVDYYGNYCLFNKPMKNYTYQSNAYTTGNSLYYRIWQEYINERYNRNNKVVTCYVHLTPNDFRAFDWNHFVYIGNQLYAVNKIYDYDAVTNQKVKVDLITIQDIKGYITRENYG